MTDNELFFKLCALAREFGGGERENKLTPIKYLIAACNYAANIVKGHVKDDSEAVKKLLSIMPLEDTTLIMAHTRLADFYDAENGVDASDEVRYFYSLSESCGSYVSAYDMYCLCLIACRDFAPVLFAFMEHSLRKQGTPLNDPTEANLRNIPILFSANCRSRRRISRRTASAKRGLLVRLS